LCRLGYLFHRQVERVLIGLGWPVEAAQLSHELKRRCANLFLCRRRLEVEQGLDIPAQLPTSNTELGLRGAQRFANHRRAEST
jgi:hypothetical protein